MSTTTIATGTYIIENVHRHNNIFLADDGNGTLVSGSSELNADPSLKLRNGRITISPAAQQNKYASCPSGFSLGSVIVSSLTASDWLVKEGRVKETYVISHVTQQLCWGVEDDIQGTPVRLYHPATGNGNQWKFRQCLASTPDEPQSVIASPTIDGSEIDSQTASSHIQPGQVDDGRPAIQNILERHAEPVYSVAYSPNGERIVSGSYDGTIRVWDVRTMNLSLKPIEAHREPVNSVAFSPDGKRLVSGSYDQTVQIWEVQSWTLALTLNGHSGSVKSVACSPDSKCTVSGSDDKTVCVWDVETGRLILGPLYGHTSGVTSVSCPTEGKLFSSCSYFDATIRVWDMETGDTIRTLTRDVPHLVWSANISPDASQIVSAGAGGIVTVWDVQSGDFIMLRGHRDSLISVTFSPDGERIVSGGYDCQIIVWDAHRGKAIGRLTGHTKCIHSVQFSPDGRWIVSGSADRTVRIWEADRLDVMTDSDMV
ncbi:WD40 repeat-like protein [Rickenella mellea]|uniref:WD40 repeat-like protein n=1 Tax=Rickenella mellea TaxID=50990 RepID=A0A4Y7PM34_9AGAM|nr:WD40 repeat-like protein [Rickenella mellea]